MLHFAAIPNSVNALLGGLASHDGLAAFALGGDVEKEAAGRGYRVNWRKMGSSEPSGDTAELSGDAARNVFGAAFVHGSDAFG